MVDDLPAALTWDCPRCGLATPEPEAHLRRAHGLSIEAVIRAIDEHTARVRQLERLLLLESEMRRDLP